jgi:hypothetical protein
VKVPIVGPGNLEGVDRAHRAMIAQDGVARFREPAWPVDVVVSRGPRVEGRGP